MRRLLEQCEKEREFEVSRRQHTDERLSQVLEANRMLAAQVEKGHDSAAVNQQVRALFSANYFHSYSFI